MIRKLLIALCAVACFAAPSSAKSPKVGEPAPPLELTLFDGSKVSLADLRGQVVVINFWATWCAPCREELPTLDAYHRILGKHGLRIFAIATEDSVPTDKLRALFGKLTIDPVRRVKGPYRIMKAVPTNYVIDRAGIVRYGAAAAFDLDDLNRILVPLLNEKAPSPLPPGKPAA
jgi:thiol-disulfide isomerase/thioredoxin